MENNRKRKKTRRIRIGNVNIGGGAPISVQSMTNTRTGDVEKTVSQIKRLAAAGCEIIRVAVPNEDAAVAIKKIKAGSPIPVIADIHFDHRLAVLSTRMGADGLRINPGNIGGKQRVQEVVEAARDHGIPIRIGVNSGSLEKDVRLAHGAPSAEALAESALRYVDLLEGMNFFDIKVSLKSSDVRMTVDAYRFFARESDIPLHVGVTEAGGLYAGITKSAIGIGLLLAEGIGDTIRVSLTRDPVEEVRVAYEILRALGIRYRGPEIISCPTCGRCEIDLFSIAEQVEKELINIEAPVKVAVMGCVVNGPGEAREADVGIAGGRGKGVLFRHGKVVEGVPEELLAEKLICAVKELEEEWLKKRGDE